MSESPTDLENMLLIEWHSKEEKQERLDKAIAQGHADPTMTVDDFRSGLIVGKKYGTLEDLMMFLIKKE